MTCWRAKKSIPSPVNLHELSRINRDAAFGQVFLQRGSDGPDAFFPVLPELPDDVLDIILINQGVAPEDFYERQAVFTTVKNFLLVFPWDLGIRNEY